MNYLTQLSKTYHGKLLLAGEYTVIDGGSSIALPLTAYKAFLRLSPDTGPHVMWSDMIQFFKNSDLDLNYDLFTEDMERGLYFHSDIPIGYGAGSSGALIAALYDRYHLQLLEGIELQSFLGKMENYFHGKSSGIDPYVIYTNRTVLSKNGEIQFTENTPDMSKWFLLDSGISRSTATYVDLYKKTIRPENSENIMRLLQLNESLISQILYGYIDVKTVNDLSILQFDLFKPMIPPHIHDLWELGLQTDEYFLKLCGAGGGGFFLVFSDKTPPNFKGIIPLQSI